MKRILFLLATASAAIPAKASACAVCMGDPNSYLADAINSTIWMMLGLVAVMFTGTALTAYFIWRHAKRPVPPHIELVESLNAEPEEC